MLSYPIRLNKDGDTYLATSKDFPELTTFGDTREEALQHAIDALEEAIAARMAHKEDIPLPGTGRNHVALPIQTEMKVLLYRTMRERGLTKYRLGKKLNWHAPQVDRLFDLRHGSRIDQLEAAFAALDAHMDIEVRM